MTNIILAEGVFREIQVTYLRPHQELVGCQQEWTSVILGTHSLPHLASVPRRILGTIHLSPTGKKEAASADSAKAGKAEE